RADVRVAAPEESLGEGDDPPLDLVDEDVPLVVPFPGEALRVPVPEIAQEHLPGEGTNHVLRGDHREALREPLVVTVHLLLDDGDVLVHGADLRGKRGTE